MRRGLSFSDCRFRRRFAEPAAKHDCRRSGGAHICPVVPIEDQSRFLSLPSWPRRRPSTLQTSPPVVFQSVAAFVRLCWVWLLPIAVVCLAGHTVGARLKPWMKKISTPQPTNHSWPSVEDQIRAFKESGVRDPVSVWTKERPTYVLLSMIGRKKFKRVGRPARRRRVARRKRNLQSL